MNLGEKLRKLISDNVDKARPFFAYVIEQNEDFSWQVQPVDNQPVIYGALTFQEEADGMTPAIGSLVLCVYIDQFSCFITEIIDYDDWFTSSNISSTLHSQDILLLNGNRVVILGDEQDINQTKSEIDDFDTWFDNLSTGILCGNNLPTGNDNSIIMSAKKSVFIAAKELSIIKVQNDLLISATEKNYIKGYPAILDSNNITLNQLLDQIKLVMDLLKAYATSMTPTGGTPAALAALETGIALYETLNTQFKGQQGSSVPGGCG